MGVAVRTNDDVFRNLAEQVSALTGVILGEKQKSLVESRLLKRFRDLGFESALEYWNYYNENRNEEITVLVSLLTTHHTFFFREWAHFEFLERELPAIVKRVEAQGRKSLRIWSAACSMGHEVYSLAMFLETKFKAMGTTLGFEILGTDVDEKSVKMAQNGVYRWSEVQKVPAAYLADHWARGTGDIRDYVKARDSLKKHCHFKPVNLLTIAKDMANEKFDVIFCRNVFIYFSREQIQSVVTEFFKNMHEGGHLILGLSESLYEMDVPVTHLGQSIYLKGKTEATTSPFAAKTAAGAPLAKPSASPTKVVITPKSAPAAAAITRSFAPKTAPVAAPAAAAVSSAGVVRVVCIDDSPSVLKLLSSVFARNPGFKVVGTAHNGLEARELLKQVQADVMTLDIHMPEQDGIEYLQKNYGPDHPPVVMLSSVARGDAKFALKALEYGASDYIEKPSLETLASRQDEILAKVSLAAKSKVKVDLSKVEVERSFARDIFITQPENKGIVIFASLRDKQKLTYFAKSLLKPHPPVVFVLDALDSLMGGVHETLSKEWGLDVKNLEDPQQALNVNRMYVAKVSDFVQRLRAQKGRELACGVISPTLPIFEELAKVQKPAVIIVEESVAQSEKYRPASVVPFTSFAYDLTRLLADKKEVA